ncbi:MAG: hypothetical protein IKU19_05415, partial [Clostridia bacterium]|nr:hypothetical protein [Clostridia bacterium]
MNKKNLRKPRRRSNGSVTLIIIFVVLLVLAIGSMIGYALFDKFMSSVPEVNSTTPWQSDDDSANSTPVTREEGSYNFLVVGRDVVALNTDVMMIVNLDLDDNSMTIMQMPRDTFITVNSSPKKLNSVFG